jgi:hypothetical protein
MSKQNQSLKTIDKPGTDADSDGSNSYQAVKYNAMTHGILSRHTVLPHEDRSEYDALLSLLIQEHQPQGITEAHLVEEIAAIIWRKQRVLQAEGAKINEGMNAISGRSGSVYSDALPFHSGMSQDDIKLYDLLRMTDEEVIDYQQTVAQELKDIIEAINLLENDKPDYPAALDLLCEQDREWWAQVVEDGDYEETAESLLGFVLENFKPWYEHQNTVAQHHAEIKAQAFGEGIQAHRIEKLNRYETHLDRKFQRTLAMLIKLKELRNTQVSK